MAGTGFREIDDKIRDIKKAKLNITIEGDLKYFLVVNIYQRKDGTIHISQPHLIDKLLRYLKLPDNEKAKSTPVSSSKILLQHSYSPEYENLFHYK